VAFEDQLRALVLSAQMRVHPSAFVMIHPHHITVAHFDARGSLVIIADAKMSSDNDNTTTFSSLYSQLNEAIRLRGFGGSNQEM
jgi:hypothetical protein